jgi:hypothetical protein
MRLPPRVRGRFPKRYRQLSKGNGGEFVEPDEVTPRPSTVMRGKAVESADCPSQQHFGIATPQSVLLSSGIQRRLSPYQ